MSSKKNTKNANVKKTNEELKAKKNKKQEAEEEENEEDEDEKDDEPVKKNNKSKKQIEPEDDEEENDEEENDEDESEEDEDNEEEQDEDEEEDEIPSTKSSKKSKKDEEEDNETKDVKTLVIKTKKLSEEMRNMVVLSVVVRLMYIYKQKNKKLFFSKYNSMFVTIFPDEAKTFKQTEGAKCPLAKNALNYLVEEGYATYEEVKDYKLFYLEDDKLDEIIDVVKNSKKKIGNIYDGKEMMEYLASGLS